VSAAVAGVCALLAGAAGAAGAAEPAGRPKDKALVASGAALEKVASDLSFSEGPAWHPSGYLLFEDIPKNRILKLDRDGKVSVFREPSGRSNGLAFDKQGRLLAAEGNSRDGGRRISRTEKDGRVVTVADAYGGKKLNSPNDLVADSRGRVFFTDPRYGDRAGVEQDKEAVYRVDPDGKVTRVIDTVARPNGIALAPDEKTLYVADNAGKDGPRLLLGFDVATDGAVSNRRVLYEIAGDRGIDGMVVDAAGRIWATAGTGEQAGVHVFELDRARAKATLLTVVKTPEDPTNCTFGGPRRDTLYITTAKSLFRIKTAARGIARLPGK
jgi:gluconolactonase